MAIYKCKKCGGDLNIIDKESSLCECEYCGSKETLPTVDNEKKLKLYDRANRLRIANEFDKAASIYESIVEESDTEAEAYWGLLLCKYGIEYVDDPNSGDKIPTCHRLSFENILDDPDFELVMENSDAISRNVYRDNAKQIEEVRRGIIELSDKEEPYDIFICYKETDEAGNRTVDSVIAQDVYDLLTNNGYKVFFSRITLEDKLGQEYEPYIFAALNSAKVMLAFGTSFDYYNAVWVKNEWGRYLKLMEKDKSKRLIPCYKDIDAYDIPKEFKHLQAQDMGKVGAEQDLLRGIDKILGKSKNIVNESNKASMQGGLQNDNNWEPLLERGFMTLEDGDFKKADACFEDVLNQNPKCAEAYMGKLLSCYNAKNINEFSKLIYKEVLWKEHFEYIELDYDANEMIREKYFLGNQFTDMVIRDNLSIVSVTNSKLQEYNPNIDYAEIFFSLENATKFGDKYYDRFKLNATDDLKEKYNINSNLSDLVSRELKEELERVEKIKKVCSKEGIEEILELANDKIKAIIGDEYEQIESKYQKELAEWKNSEEKKQLEYENDCKFRKEHWQEKRLEIQNEWKKECERLTEEYNIKKKAYEIEKNHVEAHNNGVLASFNRAKDTYENDMRYLETHIGNMQSELSGLGLFKGKKKEELKQNIVILEEKRNLLVKPILENFGEMQELPKEVEELQLPAQPEDSDVPFYLERPVQSEKPIRNMISTNIDAIYNLCVVFEDKGFLTKYIRKIDQKIITFGKDKDKNPLEWIVLSKKENEALLISKNIVDLKAVDDTSVRPITWEKCKLREYLNNEFFLNTFSGEEQAKIIPTKIKNEDTCTDEVQSDTIDKVFCLSIDEVSDYFMGDDERIASSGGKITHETIEKMGLTKSKYKELLDAINQELLDDKFCYWLRTGTAGYNFKYVENNGTIDFDYAFEIKGVRPALWLKLD